MDCIEKKKSREAGLLSQRDHGLIAVTIVKAEAESGWRLLGEGFELGHQRVDDRLELFANLGIGQEFAGGFFD